MRSNLCFSSRRIHAKAVIGGCLLIAAGSCFVSRSEFWADELAVPQAESSGAVPAMPYQAPTAPAAQAPLPAEAGAFSGTSASVPAEAPPVTIFTPDEAAASLDAMFDKIVKRENLSTAEVDELQTRLLASIDQQPAVAKVVEQFYHAMPAEQGMERDILRSLLVVSQAGRSIVLNEANTVWAGKTENKFAEMYETYFNMPGQAPPDVMGRALADVRSGSPSDDRTAVARLNFIGTLAEQKNGDAANVRADAVQLLNQVADSQGSEMVRALAVQKLYRLNSPAEASNIALAQLSKGVYGDLVRETLSSVNSGDVELTPNLRTALTTAVQRPAASAEEKQQLSQTLASHG